MAREDLQRIAQALDASYRRTKKGDELDAYLGKPDGSGGHTVPVAHHPGYSYIRGTDGIEGWIGEAVNIGAMQNPALKLEVAKKNGVLVVRSPDASSAVGVLGANAPAAGSTPVIETINTGTGAPIASTRVERGHLSLYGTNNVALGGLRVRITAYAHRGGAWDGAHVETLTPTATSGMHSYILCGINTKTNAFTQALSQNRALAQELVANDYAKIMRQYPDVDWRAAIDVANSATSLDEGKIVDLRNFGESRPKTNYTATTAPTSGDDIDDGYSVGSVWIDVTGDAAYACVDATAGAAVWKAAGDFLSSGTIAMTGALNFNGQDANAVNWLNFDDSTELTIASGAITTTQTFHRVDTEADAAADDLDTINGGSDGRILVLRAENGGRSVVLKHNTGNIQTYSGTDVTLNETYMPVLLVYDGTLSKWLAFGGGGASGGATTALDNLASVAINTSLVSDTDSTDDLGSTANYWRNGYIDTLYLSEQSAPSTPTSGKVAVYPKSDGKLYLLDDAGTETDLTAGGGSGGALATVQAWTELGSSAASLSKTSISGSYDYLEVILNLRTDRAGQKLDDVIVSLNSDTTAGNYRSTGHYITGANASGVQTYRGVTVGGFAVYFGANGAGATSNYFAAITLRIYNYASTVPYKTMRYDGYVDGSGALDSDIGILNGGGIWLSTSAITSVTIVPRYGSNFVTGSSWAIYAR